MMTIAALAIVEATEGRSSTVVSGSRKGINKGVCCLTHSDYIAAHGVAV